MYKRVLGVFLTGALIFFGSCIDDTYDLANKEISTDIEFKNNKLAFPLGSIQTFVIDSLFKDVELIDITADGAYCIKRCDTIHIEENVHPILLAIGTKSITKKIPVPVSTSSFYANSQMRTSAVTQKSIPFEMEKSIPFEHKEIFRQFKSINSFTLNEKMLIQLNIQIDGLNALQKSSVDLDFTLDFAPFFEILESNDPGVIVDKSLKNRVQITKGYPTQSNQGITVDLYCSRLNFKKEFEDGLTLEHIENDYQSHIAVSGKMLMNCNSEDLPSLQQIKEVEMNVNCSFAPVYAEIANGTFSDDFEIEEKSFTFDLGDQFTSIITEGINITFAEPQVEFELHNSICMHSNIELKVVGKDQDGEIIPATEFKTVLPVKPAQYDETTGKIMVDTSKVFFSSDMNLFKDDYVNVEVQNLQHWLEHMPDSMCFSVHPQIDYNYSPHVLDLYQPLNISTPYQMLLPFKFSNFHIIYSDTIPASLDVEMESFSNVGLRLKMNVTNTTPLGLTIKTTGLDENNMCIEDITIAPILIKPGHGEDVKNPDVRSTQEVSLAINSKSGNFTQLKQLSFDIEVDNEENTTAIFKPKQGIHISDIVIEVSGDFSTNMNE